MSTLSTRSHRQLPHSPPTPNQDSAQFLHIDMQMPHTPQSPSQHTSKQSPIDTTQPFQHETTTLPTPAHTISEYTTLCPPAMSSSPNSNKRKRLGDDGDSPELKKKVHVEQRELGIEDLHLDVGEKYRLCKTQHPQVQPDLAKDLFELYNLNPTALTVARTLPTGEKNALRKTYKGKIKDLNISGKFDVTVQPTPEDSMFAMMCVPDAEWHLQHVRTAPISGGLPAHALNLLPKAMLMTKGDVPKRAWDRAVLGDLDEKKEIKKLDKRSNLLATNTKSSASASLGSVVRPTAVSTPRGTADNRPKRKIKQRSYGDTSYEGYGEGYVDDEMVDGGYSDGDAGDRGDLKRRRKDAANTSSSNMPTSSYGPGMVGA